MKKSYKQKFKKNFWWIQEIREFKEFLFLKLFLDQM